MLKAENITLHYGSSQILYGVSVAAKLNEITCVMGSNGVGKTSLLRVLSGTHASSGGTYYLGGEEVTNSRADLLAKSGVAYVPQGRLIFPMLTVRENLQTGFACLTRDQHVIPDDIYTLFPVLKTMLDRRGGDLSGGQQQQLDGARRFCAVKDDGFLGQPVQLSGAIGDKVNGNLRRGRAAAIQSFCCLCCGDKSTVLCA